MKNADPESRLVELLKAHGWNAAVRLLREEQEKERVGASKALGRVSVGTHRGDRGSPER